MPPSQPSLRSVAYVPVCSPGIGDPPLKGSLHRRVRELLTITPPRILHEPPDIMPPGTQSRVYIHLRIYTPGPTACWEGIEAFSSGGWKVWLMCNRISQPPPPPPPPRAMLSTVAFLANGVKIRIRQEGAQWGGISRRGRGGESTARQRH